MICETSRHFDWEINRLGQETFCGMDQAKIRCIRWGSRRNSGGYEEDKQKEGKRGIYLACSEFFPKSRGIPRKKAESLAFVFSVCGDQATDAVVQPHCDFRCLGD